MSGHVRFAGKVVLVTGSSSGIGATTAIEFAKQGACVVLNGRNKSKLLNVEERCFANGVAKSKILTVVADITDKESIGRLVSRVLEHFGGVDILVNNAGHVAIGTAEEGDERDLDEMYNVHVRSAYLLTRALIPSLSARKGSVINVSSVTSIKPKTGIFAYCVAKAAQDMMTRALALELAEKRIRVNSVNPSYVRTSMDSSTTAEEMEKFYQRVGKVHPLEGRCIEPAEVADSIMFLASDAARFTSGVHLPVDGGLLVTMTMPPRK